MNKNEEVNVKVLSKEERENAAATLVQKIYKGYLTRRVLGVKLHACKVLLRTENERILNATLLIQRQYRSYRLRKSMTPNTQKTTSRLNSLLLNHQYHFKGMYLTNYIIIFVHFLFVESKLQFNETLHIFGSPINPRVHPLSPSVIATRDSFEELEQQLLLEENRNINNSNKTVGFVINHTDSLNQQIEDEMKSLCLQFEIEALQKSTPTTRIDSKLNNKGIDNKSNAIAEDKKQVNNKHTTSNGTQHKTQQIPKPTTSSVVQNKKVTNTIPKVN